MNFAANLADFGPDSLLVASDAIRTDVLLGDVAPLVVVHLVGHLRDDHAVEAGQREVEDKRAVLVQRLLPVGVHRQVAHHHVDEAVRVRFEQLLNKVADWPGKLAVRRVEDDQLALADALGPALFDQRGLLRTDVDV